MRIRVIENGKRYDHKSGISIEVTNDASFFTFYDRADKPVGTLRRPRIYQAETKVWEAFNTNGDRLVARTTCAATVNVAFKILSGDYSL